MEVFRSGKFSLNLFNKELAQGLKKNSTQRVNDGSMEELVSFVGQEEILSSVPLLNAIDTSFITTGFPYPQIFATTNYIILCDIDKIYEYSIDHFDLKLTVTAGDTWKIIDFYNYLYLSNNEVSIVRDSLTQEYSISNLPITEAMCNFNGQVFISGENI